MGRSRASPEIVEALRRNGELENHADRLPVGQRLHAREHRALAEKVLPWARSRSGCRRPARAGARPGGPPSGGAHRAPATILDAADVALGRVADGRLASELLADRGAEWGRDILIENGNGANGVPAYRGIRTYRFKYVEHRTTGRVRALRPREGPLRAREHGRLRPLRQGAARPQVTAARAGGCARGWTALRDRT